MRVSLGFFSFKLCAEGQVGGGAEVGWGGEVGGGGGGGGDRGGRLVGLGMRGYTAWGGAWRCVEVLVLGALGWRWCLKYALGAEYPS